MLNLIAMLEEKVHEVTVGADLESRSFAEEGGMQPRLRELAHRPNHTRMAAITRQHVVDELLREYWQGNLAGHVGRQRRADLAED